MAISQYDSSLCERIKDEYIKDECHKEIQKIQEDFTICEQIPIRKYRDYCYLEINESCRDFRATSFAKNIKLCNKIKDQNLKDFCYVGIIGREERYSSSITNNYNYFVGNKEKNYICEQIKNKTNRDICYQYANREIWTSDLEALFFGTPSHILCVPE